MKGFEPSLLEKLLDDAPKSAAAAGTFKSVSLEQYKESVARDLEGLLNSRAAYDEDQLEAFPHCRQSLMTYGLRDFSGMSLANAYDRAAICRSLEQAIARHEPRLANVKVAFNTGLRSTSALHFSIHGLLNTQPAREPISFDAMLQTSTNHYSIKRARRASAAA
ncbi:type VI secretion system baseplate subunit TssE [Pseudoxanthomonas kalamensis DSM 18571]|uniref:type VI secretion system baseplate subunit TssE n=1 Tax=Pseudoxanthomonas kalamensis TaxID=289483 RepID=UPI001391CA6C|nr:type VI secretion system baseplate subunit TssE [Pseudoxanthomonas kalamensis]KAF1712001.1 type VI secretion system baseplate subunit TssE [Pseudoxanthomonas kalamensis DSM 18571]